MSRFTKMNPRDLKIKQIVETTRCTHSEAEEALQENANELEAAVSWILDHNGDNVWTESKVRKAKKTDVVEEQRSNRFEGRRGGVRTREWCGKNGKSALASVKPIPVPVMKDAADPAHVLQNAADSAPLMKNAADPAPVMKYAVGPMSFAAICALGKKPPQPQADPAPASSAAPKPTISATTPAKPVSTSSSADEPSPASATSKPTTSGTTPVKAVSPPPTAKESSPVPPETPPQADLAPSSSAAPKPTTTTTTPVKPVSTSSSAKESSPALHETFVKQTRGIVEFPSDWSTNKSYDFLFGFNPESSTTVEESSFKSSNNSASAQNDDRSHENDVYKSLNVESSSPANKPLASAASQLSNSYGMQQSGSVASPQQQPLHQQHTSQQQMYNQMYAAFPYMNYYNPAVAGRADDTPYPTPYPMQYAFDMNSMAQMIPQMQPMQAAVSSQQQPQPTHRADHHQNFSDMKRYLPTAPTNPNASTVNPQRDANISSSNVPPPPGFSGPPANHMFPNQHMAHMFNVNHYPTMFMKQMPNQMYGQQNVDDSLDTRHQTQAKIYGQSDKYSNGSNRMSGASQPNPPPAQGYGGAGGQQNSYHGNGQMNSVLNPKKPYHGGQ
jgi:hypothetical protein